MRVLFVNRMAFLERGGGETFDLEIARHLAAMGCEVTFLCARPVFGRPGKQDGFGDTGDQIDRNNKVNTDEKSTANADRIPVIFLRSPYLPWFPWDKIKGGWRIRTWEFQWFERRAAAWIWRNQGRFDVIQVCELPYLVRRLKVEEGLQVSGCRFQEAVRDFPAEADPPSAERLKVKEEVKNNAQHSTSNIQRPIGNLSSQSKIQNPKSKIVLRLTAPNAYDPWGGIQLADAVIASGTSIEKIRKKLRPDVVDVPNGVDLQKFGSRILDFGLEEGLKGERAKGRKGKELQVAGCGLQEEKEHESRDQHVRRRPCEGGRPETSTNFSAEGGQIANQSAFAKTSTYAEATADIKSQIHSFRSRLGIHDDAFVFLYVARFQLFKNHEMMLEAFGGVLAERSDAWLVLAGTGPLLKMLELKVRQSDLKAGGVSLRERVLFLGEVGFADMPDLYGSANVKVISSEYESFCFAAIEAMACGLPVVTTDCGWVTRLIGDSLPPIEKQWIAGGDAPAGRFEVEEDGKRIRGTPGGLISSRTDAQSLAAAMLRMADDPELQRACGAWSRARAVAEHGWESSASKLLKLYEQLCY